MLNTRNPFINPMILINCQHTFCLNCLTQSMKMTSLICPIDRSRITSLKDIQPATRLIQLLVEELKIKCDLCQQIMERSLFLIHKLECRHHDVTHGDGGGEGEGEEGEEVSVMYSERTAVLWTNPLHVHTLGSVRPHHHDNDNGMYLLSNYHQPNDSNITTTLSRM